VIESLDHVVLTVRDLARSRDFYGRVLGMVVREQENRPLALHFGNQKLHLHQAGKEFSPKAAAPTPGAGDLCFLTAIPLEDLITRLDGEGIAIEVGPVTREGATGRIRSIYVRDPDGNLIEIANPL
jgi:catechol 2,3-dioxygenase-like lactoylglutathione lyase family enzyme